MNRKRKAEPRWRPRRKPYPKGKIDPKQRDLWQVVLDTDPKIPQTEDYVGQRVLPNGCR